LLKTWDKLIAWARSYGIEDLKQRRFALCHDNPAITPTEKCKYEAAVVVSPDARIVEPFFKVVIPPGQYAVAHYKGAPEGTRRLSENKTLKRLAPNSVLRNLKIFRGQI
jgi:AraC family transcriptional regulator